MCKIQKNKNKKIIFFFLVKAQVVMELRFQPCSNIHQRKKKRDPPKKNTLELVPKQNEEKKKAEEKKVASNRTSSLQSGQDRQNALKEPVSCTAFSHYGQTRACTCRKPERSSCFTALCFCVGFRPPALAEEDPEPELNQGESGRRRK